MNRLVERQDLRLFSLFGPQSTAMEPAVAGKTSVNPSDLQMCDATAEANRCRREIVEIEAQLRARHPDIEGLCRALADWSAGWRSCETEIDSSPPNNNR
jgi:hypothetical protein